MSGLTLTGELTKATVTNDKTGFFLEIYYPTTREGRPDNVFQSVALSKEHMDLCPLYASLVNKQISIPVKVLVTKKGTPFYLTSGDGKPLE